MRNILFVCAGLMLILQSCYDEYKVDAEFTGTYFAMQSPLRTLVIEEDKDLSFEVGVVLSGKYANNVTEFVDFEMPASFLDSTDLELLPSSYYDISSTEQFVIESGTILGTVKITLKEDFINDPLAHTVHYALPFRITNSTTDSIVAGMDSTIVAVRYHNKYYGAYWSKGVDITLDDSNNPVSEFVYSNEDLVKNLYTIFSTTAKDTSIVDFMGADKSGKNTIKLGIREDGSLTVEAGTIQSTISNVNGTGAYNKDERIFTLDYTYMKDNGGVAEKHNVKDTLYYFDTPLEVEEWQ